MRGILTPIDSDSDAAFFLLRQGGIGLVAVVGAGASSPAADLITVTNGMAVYDDDPDFTWVVFEGGSGGQGEIVVSGGMASTESNGQPYTWEVFEGGSGSAANTITFASSNGNITYSAQNYFWPVFDS